MTKKIQFMHFHMHIDVWLTKINQMIDLDIIKVLD